MTMRPPIQHAILGGRLVFAALSVLIAWQLHITAAGMNVPLQVIVVAAVAMFAVSLRTKNRWFLLLSALTVQLFVHFGSALPLFEQHCHEATGLTSVMIAAHVLAAAAGWALMSFSEDLIAFARQLVPRPLTILLPITFLRDTAVPVVSSQQKFKQFVLDFRIGSRAPPQYV